MTSQCIPTCLANQNLGHAKLEFPTTCPLCDHTPLEADTCTPNKSLRNTMRAWLQKAKKKEEAKKAEALTVEANISTIPPTADSIAENVTQGVESAQKEEDGLENNTSFPQTEDVGGAVRATSVPAQSEEVSLSSKYL